MSPRTRRKVRDATEAAELLARQASSGLSMSAWCASEGIDGRSLGGYRSQLPEPIRLVEVTCAPAAPPTRAAVYRLRVADVVIELDDAFQAETLSRLLGVVRSC